MRTYFCDARRTGATHVVNTIVNSLCLDAPVIVFCAAEAPLGLVFSTSSLRSSDFHPTIPTGSLRLR